MKQLIPIVLFAALGIGCPVLAADDAAATAHQSTATDVANFEQQMGKMQELMNQMQEQMRKIDATNDQKERQKLLTQHWDSMRQGMQMMHGMWQSGMMGPMGPGMTTDQMAQHQLMMNQYMGMQQMMMQHMWGHQGWMMGPHGHMMGQHHHMMDMWQ